MALHEKGYRKLTLEELKAKHEQAITDALRRRCQWEAQYRKNTREKRDDRREFTMEPTLTAIVYSRWMMLKAQERGIIDEFLENKRDANWERDTRADLGNNRKKEAAAFLDEEEKIIAALDKEIGKRKYP